MVKRQDWLEQRRRQEWEEERRLEERRKILERRRKQRADAQDRRTDDRRREQICFVCRTVFEPKKSGDVVCPQCTIDGARGGSLSVRRKPPF